MQNPWASIACLLVFAVSASAAEKSFVVVVEAGDFDRRDSLVEFAVPQAAAGPRDYRYYIQSGEKSAPVQIGKNGLANFRIEEMKKGTRLTYELVRGSLESRRALSESAIYAQREGDKLNLSLVDRTGPADKKRPLMDYQAEPGKFPRDEIKPAFRRGGYLHPIRTPLGRMVTDDFPPNHIHHHGVWWAWTNTEFDGRKPDFWNMGDGKGRVEFVSLDDTWSGPVHGGFRARHRFVDLTAPEPVTALNEWWQVSAYAPQGGSASYWMFDLVSEQLCATASGLKLPEYRYGGVGVRGNRAWDGKENAMFLTSDGETDREKGHATRGRWCDMGGLVDGSRVGIAILCHPDNFRAPQPMRIHPTEPFFNFAPQQAGDMEIKPGDKYVSRYRFVVHDGPPDKAELDRLWNDYAHPPVVRVTEK